METVYTLVFQKIGFDNLYTHEWMMH